MKQYSKSIIALFCGLLSASFALSAGQISKTVSFTGQSLSVNQTMVNGVTYSDLSFGDLINGAETGAPALPRKYVAIALPANAANIKVSSVSVNKGNTTQLIFPVIPEREPASTNGTPEPSLSQDKEIYESESAYPSSAVNICSVIDYWGVYAVVGLQITPMEYFPSYGEVRTYNDVSFTLSYDLDIEDEDSNFLWMKMSDKEKIHTLNLLKEDVYNPEDVSTSVPSRPRMTSVASTTDNTVGGIRVYTYSIITSRALGKAFERLASLKRQTGLDAGIIYIEDILANPLVQRGDTISRPIINAETGEMAADGIIDDAGKLRQFLYYAAGRTDLQYVLLGGKYPVIPIRYGTPGGERSSLASYESISDLYHVPTDWYFSSFKRNWNQDGDVFYGEQKERDFTGRNRTFYSSSLYLGRIPCTTPDEVNNYIDKLEFYILNPGNGDTSYLTSAYSHFSEPTNTYTKETAPCGYIRSAFNDYDIYTQTETKHLGGYTPQLVSDLSNKHYALLDFHCHGNPPYLTVFDGEWSGLLCALDRADSKNGREENFNGLDNIQNFGYPGIMYSIACEIAAFDAPNYCGYSRTGNLRDKYGTFPMTVAESYLLGKNYGGAAMIANSREGYFETSVLLEKNFFQEFFRSGAYSEIGRLYNSSKYSIDLTDLDSGSGYYGYWVRLSQNLLGDPQLRIWLGEPIKLIDFNVSRGSNYVGINWQGDYGANITPQCEAIVVEPDGTVHKDGMSSNLASFNVNSNALVSVIGNNMLPYIGDLSLQNITFDKYSYVYAKEAETGSQIRTLDQGDVVFATGAEYVIDASEAVSLKSGTIIKNGACLRVYSPVSCRIDGLTIENGGRLEVHSPVLIYEEESIPSAYPSSKVITYGYDKYGDPEAETIIIDRNKMALRSRRTSEYIPMFEIGKSWKYTIHDYTMGDNGLWDPDTDFLLRVDGTTDIDGKEYYVVNAYTAGTTTPDNNTPYGYFREDPQERVVYYRHNPEYKQHMMIESFPEAVKECQNSEPGEIVLIDFKNYTESLGFDIIDSNDKHIFSEFNAADGVHAGFAMSSSFYTDRFGCYEGLGLIINPEYFKYLDGHSSPLYPNELIGFYPSMKLIGDREHWPALYLICAPDGTKIYSFDQNRPYPHERPEKDGVDGVNAEWSGRTEIAYEDGVVRVRSDREIGEVSVAGMQGAMVKYMQINEPTAEIPVDDLQLGVYVVKAADATAKIVIR